MTYCKCWAPEEANGKLCERCDGQRPTAADYQLQVDSVKVLNSINFDKNPERFHLVLGCCTDFESKYC
jgi:hypothetical protein